MSAVFEQRIAAAAEREYGSESLVSWVGVGAVLAVSVYFDTSSTHLFVNLGKKNDMIQAIQQKNLFTLLRQVTPLAADPGGRPGLQSAHGARRGGLGRHILRELI